MKDSYLTAGIRLDRLIRLLRKNKISYTPSNLLRVAFLLQSASWSSIFSLLEKTRFSKILKNAPAPTNPVFIVGHWRTGSTLLHQIMNLDPDLHAPTLFQVAIPDSFLFSYPYYRPIFKYFVSKHRPMDMVKLGMDEPQEDEYAIFRLTESSSLEDLVFPKSDAFFLMNSENLYPEHNTELWKKQLASYFTKLSFQSRKTIVSKNPFNSFRIKLLVEIFPQAKFIHIHRHPYEVVPSTIHMWNIVQQQNCLNNNYKCPEISEVVSLMNRLLCTVEESFRDLPDHQKAEIRFEDLEKDPMMEMKKLYSSMKMSFHPEFEDNIKVFSREMIGFKKNKFSLSKEEKEKINVRLENHMKRLSYSGQ